MKATMLGRLRGLRDKLSARWSAASYNERLDAPARGLLRSRRLDAQSFNERLDRRSRRR
jgi:hypothetical protein